MTRPESAEFPQTLWQSVLTLLVMALPWLAAAALLAILTLEKC